MTKLDYVAHAYMKIIQPTTSGPLLATNATHASQNMCSAEWKTMQDYITSIGFIIPALALTVFNIVVVVGNLLVIMSVFSCKKLRTITNTYIVSLAFSDLFLGVLVLPFSGTKEVLQDWIFGEVWCDIWLAVDVWICTASILNLCAISFDRYLAISRPFKYQTLVSPVKAKVLVTAVWVVAFLICLPPLIGWNERGTSILDEPRTEPFSKSLRLVNYTMYNQTYGPEINKVLFVHDFALTTYNNFNNPTNILEYNCPQKRECELIAEPGYIIYSALGSFWIPVWIMVFFYGRIYMIAAKTTKGVRRGVIHTKSNGSNSASSPVTLRIHRGGTFNSSVISRSSNRPSISQTESLLPTPPVQNGTDRVRQHSFCDTEDTASTIYKQLKRNSSVPIELASNGTTSKKPPKIKVTFCRSTRGKGQFSRLEEYPGPCRKNGNVVVHCPIEEETSFNMTETCIGDNENVENGRRTHRRVNIRTKIRTFNREKKAAKTVGIIVGCFIFCWAPFFSAYLLGAFCEDCTPRLMFTVFFWLGYSNSAINPFVYALFSKDFRFAFKKLLTCRCERQKVQFKDRRRSRLRTFLNSLKIQISSRSSDDTNLDTTCD